MDYESDPFDSTTADPDPFVQFDDWFQVAVSAEVDQPNALVLGTVDSQGYPTSRTVLMKSFDENGVVFFTNYGSDKASDIESNPQVSLLFLWMPLHRQVRITGRATRVSDAESDEYFASRPRAAQIGAVASPQSSVIPDRAWLESRVRELSADMAAPVTRPSIWGGYRVTPNAFEFWQGRENRLHDRVRYESDGDRWQRFRLAP